MQVEMFEAHMTADELREPDEPRDETIMTEFDAVTAAIFAVRDRVEELTQARADADAELARCQSELATVREQHEADKAEIRQLETAVADERARLATARARLDAVVAALEG